VTFAPALIFSFVTLIAAVWRYRNWRARTLHPRFYDSTSARPFKTLVIIAALCFSLAVPGQLLHVSVPQRLAYTEEYLVFPLLLIARLSSFLFLPSIIVVISSINFFMISLYFETKTRRVLSSLALLALIMPLTAVMCFVQIFVLWSPVVTDRTMIRFDNQVFRIVYSEGPTEEFDYIEARYIIYECNNVGLLCRNIGAQVREYSQSRILIRDSEAFFVVDNERLYAIIGDNRITVR
jgi:hypothetical protein